MRIEYLVVHCAATPPSSDIGVAEIDAWHKRRGWAGCGYHYVVRRDGTIEKGRPDNKVGSHVKGFNSCSLGICLVGGVNERGRAEANYTESQAKALANLLDSLISRYPSAKVQGHRDFPNVNKACPCFDVSSWFEKRRASNSIPPLK